jgi:hypothetical protein
LNARTPPIGAKAPGDPATRSLEPEGPAVHGQRGLDGNWFPVPTVDEANAAFVTEAPNDTLIYGRRGSDGTWQPVEGGAVWIGPNPPDPATPGMLWWRNDPDGVLYILYEDADSTQWVPASPGSGGGAGVADGLPPGGAIGEVLTKQSAADGDADWSPPPDVANLPPGGAAGEVLTKQSGADGDADWSPSAAVDNLPPGGAAGEVLTKQSAADGDVDWSPPAAGGVVAASDVTVTPAVLGSANVQDALEAAEASLAGLATEAYVDAGDAQKLSLAGGAMTGNLELRPIPPANDWDAVPKSYVDALATGADMVDLTPPVFGSDNVQDALETAETRVMPFGGTLGQVLTKIDATDFNAEWSDSAVQDLTPFATTAYVDAQDLTKLSLAGGAMTGNLELRPILPADDWDAAPKSYVDQLVSAARLIVGSIDAATGQCVYTAQSGLTNGPLVDAASALQGHYVLCDNPGTIPVGPPEVVGLTMGRLDMLISDGADWIFFPVGDPADTLASQVGVVPSVLGADNVQTVLELLAEPILGPWAALNFGANFPGSNVQARWVYGPDDTVELRGSIIGNNMGGGSFTIPGAVPAAIRPLETRYHVAGGVPTAANGLMQLTISPAGDLFMSGTAVLMSRVSLDGWTYSLGRTLRLRERTHRRHVVRSARK